MESKQVQDYLAARNIRAWAGETTAFLYRYTEDGWQRLTDTVQAESSDAAVRKATEQYKRQAGK